MVSEGGGAANTIETQVPARIDRLPWSSWHTLVIIALGVTWVLDGLEITIQGNIADALTNPETGLGLSPAQVGYAAGIYIAGACTGSIRTWKPAQPVHDGSGSPRRSHSS